MNAPVGNTGIPGEAYRSWVRASREGIRLEEGVDQPPERWLQQIWRHQRLARDALVTTDGRALRVLHPGFWNRSAGPDFRDALIQWGGGQRSRGDVEVDCRTTGWRGHRHAANASYRQVILHVVWTTPPEGIHPPVLALKPFVDSPLDELAVWLDREAPGRVPELVLGRCAQPVAALGKEAAAEILNQAALHRLACKAAGLDVRARHSGWEQALWEGLLGALGYRHNYWPMRRLAEVTGPNGDLARARMPIPETAAAMEARIFGLAGLLPGRLPRGAAGSWVRSLWDHWWRERDALNEWCLPEEAWRRGGMRPMNQPQRRLGLTAKWATAGDLPQRIERWFAGGGGDAGARGLLDSLAPAVGDDFWSWHWSWRSARLARAQPLLGLARVTDLAMNVILPWLWARARRGGAGEAGARIEQVYLGWPAGEDNAVLRLARQRMFPGGGRGMFRTAAAQQGLLQWSADFCDESDALCTDCLLPGFLEACRQNTHL